MAARGGKQYSPGRSGFLLSTVKLCEPPITYRAARHACIDKLIAAPDCVDARCNDWNDRVRPVPEPVERAGFERVHESPLDERLTGGLHRHHTVHRPNALGLRHLLDGDAQDLLNCGGPPHPSNLRIAVNTS